MTAVNSTTLPRLPDHLLIAQPFNHRLCVVALSFAWDMYDSCHDWPGVCDQISREFLLNLRETAWLEDFGGDIDIDHIYLASHGKNHTYPKQNSKLQHIIDD